MVKEYVYEDGKKVLRERPMLYPKVGDRVRCDLAGDLVVGTLVEASKVPDDYDPDVVYDSYIVEVDYEASPAIRENIDGHAREGKVTVNDYEVTAILEEKPPELEEIIKQLEEFNLAAEAEELKDPSGEVWEVLGDVLAKLKRLNRKNVRTVEDHTLELEVDRMAANFQQVEQDLGYRK